MVILNILWCVLKTNMSKVYAHVITACHLSNASTFSHHCNDSFLRYFRVTVPKFTAIKLIYYFFAKRNRICKQWVSKICWTLIGGRTENRNTVITRTSENIRNSPADKLEKVSTTELTQYGFCVSFFSFPLGTDRQSDAMSASNDIRNESWLTKPRVENKACGWFYCAG